MFLGDKTMEALIFIVIAAGLGALWYFNREKGFDANKDGKVNLDDVKPLVENTVKAVEETAKAEVEVVKAEVKKAATRARAGAKKAATRAKTAVKKKVPALKVAK